MTATPDTIEVLAARYPDTVTFQTDYEGITTALSTAFLAGATAEREQTAALVVEIWEALEDVVNQAGGGPALLDSMALSAYADAMRLLAAHDRLVIDEEHGRRVIAHWPNKKDQT